MYSSAQLGSERSNQVSNCGELRGHSFQELLASAVERSCFRVFSLRHMWSSSFSVANRYWNEYVDDELENKDEEPR
jgi:hypothetical protein